MNPSFRVALVLLSLPCAARAASPEAEVAKEIKLDAAALQEVLGIHAAQLDLPDSFGPAPVIMVETYVDGKRVGLNKQDLTFDGPSRTMVTTVQMDSSPIRVTYKIGQATFTLTTVAAVPTAINETGSSSQFIHKTTATEVILARKQILEGKPSPRVEILVRVAKNSDPRPATVSK